MPPKHPFLPLLALAPLTPASAQVTLNPPFVRNDVTGEVHDFLLHPAGGEVLFRVEARETNTRELYRVPLDGSRRPLPIVALAPGRSVQLYEFSADGQWLVYTADKDTPGEIGLYAHRVGVPGSVRLDHVGGDVQAPSGPVFVVVGNRVVYRDAVGGNNGLFSARLDGGAPVQTIDDGPLDLLGGSVATGRVYFRADAELRSVPADGSAPALYLADADLNGPLRHGETYQLDPTGERVYFLRRVPGFAGHELAHVPLDGSAPATVVSLTGPTVQDFFLAGDGSRVVFSAADETTRQVYSADAFVPAAPVQLSDSASLATLQAVFGDDVYYTQNLVSGAVLVHAGLTLATPQTDLAVLPNGSQREVRRSADGAWVVYHLDNRIYSVPDDGSSAPVTLSGPMSAFELSPASDRVLYSAFDGLWSVPIDGSSAAVHLGTAAGAFAFTPDGAQALAIVALGSGPLELFRVDADLGASTRLSRELARGTIEDVIDCELSATAGAVFAIGRTTLPTSGGLHAALEDGSAGSVLLAEDVRLLDFQLTQDGQHAVFQHRPTGSLAPQFHSVPTDGSSAPVFLGEDPEEYRITPDGARVVYRHGFPTIGLWSRPLDGSAAAVLLAPSAESFALSPDSNVVVFNARSGSNFRLQRVPVDGSEAPVLLAEFPSGNSQPLVRFLPDGSRTVFLAYESNWRLYSASLSHAPDLQTLLVTNAGDLSLMSVLPDERLVITAKLGGFGSIRELYLLPADGSQPPQQISAGGLDVFAVWPEPDGSGAVYRTLTAPAQYQLHVVAFDGTPAHAMSPVLTSPADVGGFTPDGTRVVYTHRGEVFAAPLDGSSPALRVSRVAPPGASVLLPLVITPDSSRVAYALDPGTGVGEVWSAPLDGSSAALRLSQLLSAPGASELRLSRDGTRVLYLAPETPGVFELFSVAFPALPQVRHTQRR